MATVGGRVFLFCSKQYANDLACDKRPLTSARVHLSSCNHRVMRRSNGGAAERGADIDDKLEDLKKRFHLLEGDKKAYYETTQWTLQTNKERVNGLRGENKELYAQLSHLQRVVKARILFFPCSFSPFILPPLRCTFLLILVPILLSSHCPFLPT
jgi:hypothetical protein